MLVTHPEAGSTSSAITLSRLGIARALAAQSNRASAIDAYQHFFTLWAHADPDAKFMQQARKEFAALQSPAPSRGMNH
jgi:eukaryotic-like serine/threonine-protein kinase